MPSQTATKQRIGAAAGIASPILAFLCILTALASYPSFSWTNNALSDLSVVKGATGVLFNFGLYASGLLAFIFAVLGLFTHHEKSWVGQMGAVFYAAATASLMGIGVFNESFSGTHYAFSVAFFVLSPISLFILTCAFWLAKQKEMAIFTVVTGLIAGLPWILQFAIVYAPNVAIPETISGLAISAWTITLGIRMTKQAEK